tara:strand:+ start:420 stop:662 length:243 start_codon:yes stop_codon:yes gene_type:complete
LKKNFILIIAIICCTVEKQPFQLNDKTYTMWQNFIKPTDEELAWTKIPWRSTFYDGLVDADRLQKPVLFWAMNGHPLGCT